MPTLCGTRLTQPNRMLRIVLLFLLLAGSQPLCAQTKSATLAKAPANGGVESIIRRLKNPTGKDVLVIAHRGDWRNAPENSLPAIERAIELGVDIVEIDIHQTSDGHLVLMHDDMLDRTTTGKGLVRDHTLAQLKELYLKDGLSVPTPHRIPTMEEAMLLTKGKILVNLDRCYDYFAEAYEVLKKTGTVQQAVMKSAHPVAKVKADFGQYLDKVFFMPIVNLDQPGAAQVIRDYEQQLKPVAMELVFNQDTSQVISAFPAIQQQGSRVWVNSLWDHLSAGHNDERAVTDPEGTYGWIVKQGATLIQTDRPAMLLAYLRKRGLHP